MVMKEIMLIDKPEDMDYWIVYGLHQNGYRGDLKYITVCSFMHEYEKQRLRYLNKYYGKLKGITYPEYAFRSLKKDSILLCFRMQNASKHNLFFDQKVSKLIIWKRILYRLIIKLYRLKVRIRFYFMENPFLEPIFLMIGTLIITILFYKFLSLIS